MRETEEVEDLMDYRPITSAFHGATVVLDVSTSGRSGHQMVAAFRLRAHKGDNVFAGSPTTVTACHALLSPPVDLDHRVSELPLDLHGQPFNDFEYVFHIGLFILGYGLAVEEKRERGSVLFFDQDRRDRAES